MSIRYECDLCGSIQATENLLQPIKIGEAKIGDGCHTCASALGQGIKNQIVENKNARMAAAQAAIPPALPTEPAAPTTPTEPSTPTQPTQPEGVE